MRNPFYKLIIDIAIFYGIESLTRILLYMLPLLLSPPAMLTRIMQESATCRLYTGSDVIDTDRLCVEDKVLLGGAGENGMGGRPERSGCELEVEEPEALLVSKDAVDGKESDMFWQDLESDYRGREGKSSFVISVFCGNHK